MSLAPADGPVIVRKYGGSSLASVDRIRAVARDLAAKRREGYRLVVVVSAMGRTTDELGHLAHQAHPDPPRRELDMLLSVGERITMSLLSMALAGEGCAAISYTGSQCGIITNTSHTDARIVEVRADRVRQSLDQGHIVVVAGFQGVSVEREITTLGRGGSDTTAVALAAALGAERCEILKDVAGVFTADPHKVPAARRHDALTFEQMAQLAAAGCGVIHARAVEYAARHGVPLFVGSSFADGPGTLVGAGAPAASPPAAAHAAPPLYRPLALVVQEDVALLTLEAAGAQAAACRARLAAAGAEPFLAEWLEDEAQRLRWGAIGPPAALGRLQQGLASLAGEPGTRLLHRRGCVCCSLAGGRPASWHAARRQIDGILEACEVRDWLLIADSDVLRLLAPAAALPRLLEPLHAALFAD